MPNGTPYCTGFKQNFGTTVVTDNRRISSPVQTVAGGSNWCDCSDIFDSGLVAVSFGATFAIKADGTLWAWGAAEGGQLGNNSTIGRSSPVQTVSMGTNWKQVSAGAAIKTDGTLWLWGYRNAGALGNENAAQNRSSPVQTITTGTNWKQVSRVSSRSAAVKTDGTLWLWGCNNLGQIGNNNIIDRSSPVQTVSTGTNWKQVSLGGSSSAAIKTDGTLWLWGSSGSGALGNNEPTTDRSSPVQTVSTGTNWKQVNIASQPRVSSVKTDGTLWLWGCNNLGQIGDNNTINRSSPVQTVSTGTNWFQTGGFGASKTDGTLWVWGGNNSGYLGDNSTINRSSPVQTVSTGTNWKQFCFAHQTSIATKIDGTLWTWGCNINSLAGALGDNSTINRSSPVQTVSTGTNWFEETAWYPINGGNFFSGALKNDGTLWLWGRNSSGQLGNNSTINRSSPVQTVSTGTNWKQISLGSSHSASVKSDGTLWLWGSGVCGKIGNNSTIDQSSPVQTVSTGTNWNQVDSGYNHSASIKTDGTLWVWGSGNEGQLGSNSITSHSSPVQTVSTGTNWKQVRAGSFHTASIKTDGTLWLWGLGLSGQLGTNLTINHSSPVQTVSTGTNWKQVALGCSHSAAIKTDGTLWLWGLNNNGQLGENSVVNESSPVQIVTTGTNWRQVALGCDHSAAVKTDGTLWLWGNNSNNKLGDLSTISKSSPVQTVSTGTDWSHVELGNSHSLAFNSNKQLYVWGLNTLGQVGCDLSVTSTNTFAITDLGNILVEKEYLLDVYPNLVPWMKAPGLWLMGRNVEGQLGDNSSTNKSSPIQTITSGSNWSTVSAGFVSSGIKSDGTLWTWGGGLGGRLGNLSTINRSSPVQTVSQGNNWKEVSSGFKHHVASIKTDGTLWLWGCGAAMLGNNSIIDRSSPVQTVSTGTNWKQVAAGENHTASIKTDGTLWLWGLNGPGALGNNNVIARSSPVQTVSTGTNWKQVSSSLGSSASVKTDGTLWLWGYGDLGQLGNNSTIRRSSPVQTVSTGTNWRQVSLGICFAASIKTDGTLWMWGAGDELGTNSTIDQSSPVQTITTGTNWKFVSAGNTHTSSIKTDGTLWIWGSDTNGSFGDSSTIGRSSPVQTISLETYWKKTSAGSQVTLNIREEGEW